MKRLLLLLAFIPSMAFAQVNTSSPTGFQWSSGSGGSGSIIAGVTLASGCTANWLLYTDSTGHVNCAANMTFNGTLVTFTGNSGATGIFVTSLAGATGASDSVAASIANTSTGTAVNYGVKGTALAAAAGGTQIGGFFQAAGAGNANFAYGVWGAGNTGTNNGVAAVGVAGVATSGARRLGGLFSSNISFVPTLPAAGSNIDALLTHGGVSADFLQAADGSGNSLYRILDLGSMWAANIKNLTESSATAFAQITTSTGSMTGGEIDYCIDATDTTDFQERCGLLVYMVVNKAGTLTFTCSRVNGNTTIDNTTDSAAVSAGTLTNTFTCVDAGSGLFQVKANATSSLTQTILRINYFVRQQGNAALTFTPQ